MKKKFKVGDIITFELVNQDVVGKIVEERGPLGLDGQMVYRVEVNFEAAEPMYFELEESSISRAQAVHH